MAVVDNFDGENLICTLAAPTAGVLTLNVQEMYKEWLVWLNTGHGNKGYPPMFFEDFGGNTIVAGALNAGAYFVFQNGKGWRVRPYEADQTIYVIGQLPPSNSALPITIPTIGGYTVLFDGLQAQTESVSPLLKLATNKKELEKVGSTWHIRIYDNDDTTLILDKILKDKTGADITDFAAGVMAQELKSSV